MIWPVRTGSWPYNAVAAQNVFVDIAHIISRHEKVYILADEKHYAQAEARFMKIKDAVTGVIKPVKILKLPGILK